MHLGFHAVEDFVEIVAAVAFFHCVDEIASEIAIAQFIGFPSSLVGSGRGNHHRAYALRNSLAIDIGAKHAFMTFNTGAAIAGVQNQD
ncbi:MAG: hypothetical protein BWY75_03864 [bacterium ADurb.Bin425]|nr:MAG: hypothetical protein BWY75_03864 [bacterium ADurb.Bin425]